MTKELFPATPFASAQLVDMPQPAIHTFPDGSIVMPRGEGGPAEYGTLIALARPPGWVLVKPGVIARPLLLYSLIVT
jgi:hypothetical protein